MFSPVDSRVSFPELEERILEFWRKHEVFRRSIDARPAEKLFSFYEGPPTANARPGIHHVLTRVFKDLIPRYKTMQGYRVPRKAGWDTHGLPVELEIEKELGLSSKPDIEAYGIAEFNKKCKDSVSRYVEEWERLSERIAFWVDLKNPYVTWHNEYIETGWWILKQLWNGGLVYQDYRSTPHCPRCGTSLSDHEVSLGYEENTPDPSVSIAFRLTPESATKLVADGRPIAIIAWTTTPWTLPGNTGLAVKVDAEYGLYERADSIVIVATALATRVLGEEAGEPIARFDGASLAGLEYEPLYRPEDLGATVLRFDDEGHLQPLDGADTTGLRRVITADYVSTDDGTGIVHIAPAFGGEDFEEGKHFRMLFAQPVDLRGIMADGLPGAGKFVKDADKDVIRDLDERGLLIKSETIRHTYPFCWRCKSPLLYYAKPSWYIRTTRHRDALMAGNERINWFPGHIQNGRFGNWLENNIDWAISRERYWGSPLPFWACDDCDAVDCIGSKDELVERATDQRAAKRLDDLHRPYIDEITITCQSCSGEMHRVPEVADAWFDSGAMPYAQWHYPFENQGEFNARFPADFICEAIDQTRGWFYTLHALATTLNAVDAVPSGIAYQNVICVGHIQDEKGNKMSKSLGNAVEPWDVIGQLGADAVRWYMVTSSPAGASRRFSAGLVEEGLRRYLLTLWNTYSFFVSYANIDEVDPRTPPPGVLPEIDRWLLSELNALIEKVTSELEAYDPTGAGRAIDAFVDDLSNWYVRRSRRRFWRGVSESDADKQAAYYTLYTALVTVAKLTAPFTPFVAEELYQNLVRAIDKDAPESVHLASWPTADASRIDGALNRNTATVKAICSAGRAARAQAQIKVRQPVAEVVVSTNLPVDAIRDNEDLILDELNAKALTVVANDQQEIVDYDVQLNLPVLGPRFGAKLGELRKALAQELETNRHGFLDAVIKRQPVALAGEDLDPGDLLLIDRPRAGYAAVREHGTLVAISTTITPELADEGIARELVRRIQDFRRESGFQLADRINVWFNGDADIARVIAKHGDYIAGEILATVIEEGSGPARFAHTRFEIDGREVTIDIRKAN